MNEKQTDIDVVGVDDIMAAAWWWRHQMELIRILYIGTVSNEHNGTINCQNVYTCINSFKIGPNCKNAIIISAWWWHYRMMLAAKWKFSRDWVRIEFWRIFGY